MEKPADSAGGIFGVVRKITQLLGAALARMAEARRFVVLWGASMSSVPHIYLINLDRDTERLAYMANQLAALGLPFDRVSAVHGTAMPDWLRPFFLDTDGDIPTGLSPGEVGCYASHLMLMRRIAESGEPALVLEDDIRIEPELPELLRRIHLLPPGWDIVRLSNSTSLRSFPVASLHEQYRAVKYSRVPPSTGAYLISPDGARKFLAYRGTRHLPVDQDLRRTWEHGLATYGILPCPVVRDAFGTSSIADFGPRRRANYKKEHFRSTWLQRARFDIGWLGLRNWLVAQVMPKQRPI
jgi:glycosyl transferase family 25